jgi:hypothetical protein
MDLVVTMRLNYREVPEAMSMLSKIYGVLSMYSIHAMWRMTVACTWLGPHSILIRVERIPGIPGISYPATHDSVGSTTVEARSN